MCETNSVFGRFRVMSSSACLTQLVQLRFAINKVIDGAFGYYACGFRLYFFVQIAISRFVHALTEVLRTCICDSM